MSVQPASVQGVAPDGDVYRSLFVSEMTEIDSSCVYVPVCLGISEFVFVSVCLGMSEFVCVFLWM